MLTQTVITHAVKNYLKRERFSQQELARLLCVSQSLISRKLNNAARWTMEDLDRLTVLGIIEPIAALDVTDWGNHD